MANFYGTARSNYFKVKDDVAFKDWVTTVPNLGFWKHNKDETFAVYSDDSDSGCWPSSFLDEDENDVEFDMVEALSKHLADGEVCVLMQAGAEKLRYISGYSQAFNNTGECVQVSLDDIYALAQTKFGVQPSDASY